MGRRRVRVPNRGTPGLLMRKPNHTDLHQAESGDGDHLRVNPPQRSPRLLRGERQAADGRQHEDVAWSQNDALFRTLLKEGHSWQTLPFVFLKLKGLDVEMPNLSIREDITKASAWLETYDLKVGDHIIEVKSRPFAFTCPGDWPSTRLPAILDAQKKWDAKTIKPLAYIFISKATGGMVSTCGLESAHSRWTTRKIWDRTRGFKDSFYMVGREHLRTMDHLVAAL